MAERIMRDTPGSRPVPDPTVLTTDQLRREIGALRELMESRFSGSEKIAEIMESALSKLRLSYKEDIQRAQELSDEKFNSVETQFRERDTRAEQTAKDNKTSVDAALAAAKEAVGKTEAAFTKQMDMLSAQMTQLGKALDDKIDDVKTRVTIIESNRAGAGAQKIESVQTSKDNSALVFSIIGAVVAAAVVVNIVVSLVRP